MSYNTKQKTYLLEIIKNLNKEFTIKDIYNSVDNKIGLTTIYRLVDKLYKDGRLDRHIGNDNESYYEYLEECDNNNHFYLKCEKCKELIHVDCECINDLWTHIGTKHKFNPNKEHIIINGICDKCINKGVN